MVQSVHKATGVNVFVSCFMVQIVHKATGAPVFVSCFMVQNVHKATGVNVVFVNSTAGKEQKQIIKEKEKLSRWWLFIYCYLSSIHSSYH